MGYLWDYKNWQDQKVFIVEIEVVRQREEYNHRHV